MAPKVTRIPPRARKGSKPRKARWSRQWEIHHGAKPATNPGAMTRKTAEPIVAAAFLITPYCNQMDQAVRKEAPY